MRARLSELIRKVLAIVALRPVKRVAGTGKGVWMSRDFDEPLDDFSEYR